MSDVIQLCPGCCENHNLHEPCFEYEPCPEWKYPMLVLETEIEPGVFVRTVSLSAMNKYGNCYETVGVAGSKVKKLWYYKTVEQARNAHPFACRYIFKKRQERRR